MTASNINDMMVMNVFIAHQERYHEDRRTY